LSFLNPLFLFGLAAAAVPIVIHLFTRKRPREILFPSIEFLTEVNQSEIRRLKLKQWLLLLLRTLAVVSLALAMSRPAVRASAGLKGGAATTVVALVDQSGSMGATTPTGTVEADAQRVIEDLLSTLGPQDELQLVPYDEGPHPVTERPSADVPRLRAVVQALEPGARRTNHRRALVFAAQALARSHALNRELFWISDFQADGFDGEAGSVGTAAPSPGPAVGVAAPEGPWDQARIYLVPLAPQRRPNVGLSDAALAPSESGSALTVAAVARGARPGDLAVEVRDSEGNAELGRGFLALPEEGEVSTLVPLSRLPEQGGSAGIPDDLLLLDNHRRFAAGRAGTLRVLLREEGPASALRLALEAGSPASGLAVETVAGAVLPARIAEADVVVLHDLERLGSTELQAVLDFYRGGGGLLVVVGRRADAGFWNGALLGELGAGRLGALDAAPAGATWRLKRVVAGHPVLAGFPARPGEALSTAQFQAAWRLSPGSGSRVLLELDRAHPALVEAPHALVFTIPLDPGSSDFPVSGAYLPLLHQAVKVLGRGTAAASLAPGQRYSAPAGTGVWRIEDEHGRDVPAELVAAAGVTRLTSEPLEHPGLYRVQRGGVLRATFAVNPDPRESDLTAVSEATLVHAFPPGRAQVLRPGVDLARRVREARFGRELWAWFVAAALVLVAAETVIARWGMPSRVEA
jgi:hypothetical protein